MVCAELFAELQLERSDERVVVRRIAEKWHDIFEKDPWGGKVGKLAEGGLEGYFKTGEFGGTGGSGGGESSLGGIVARCRVGRVGRWVGGGRSYVGSVVGGVAWGLLSGVGCVDVGRGGCARHGEEKKRRRRAAGGSGRRMRELCDA